MVDNTRFLTKLQGNFNEGVNTVNFVKPLMICDDNKYSIWTQYNIIVITNIF
jgi:hypothetical protein